MPTILRKGLFEFVQGLTGLNVSWRAKLEWSEVFWNVVLFSDDDVIRLSHSHSVLLRVKAKDKAA